MKEIEIGKLINFTYDTKTRSLQVLIEITDDDFKEQIIRNSEFKEKIIFKGADVLWIAQIPERG